MGSDSSAVKGAGNVWSFRGVGEGTGTSLLRGGVMFFCNDLEAGPWWLRRGGKRRRRGFKQLACALNALPIVCGGWVGRVVGECLFNVGGWFLLSGPRESKPTAAGRLA